ncbi:MAG: hypothetical protein J6U64_02280 [Alphaproteobacteria bacterium]|nr:hypothetical protein [Alphaproteobacteria bacterium]
MFARKLLDLKKKVVYAVPERLVGKAEEAFACLALTPTGRDLILAWDTSYRVSVDFKDKNKTASFNFEKEPKELVLSYRYWKDAKPTELSQSLAHELVHMRQYNDGFFSHKGFSVRQVLVHNKLAEAEAVLLSAQTAVELEKLGIARAVSSVAIDLYKSYLKKQPIHCPWKEVRDKTLANCLKRYLNADNHPDPDWKESYDYEIAQLTFSMMCRYPKSFSEKGNYTDHYAILSRCTSRYEPFLKPEQVDTFGIYPKEKQFRHVLDLENVQREITKDWNKTPAEVYERVHPTIKTSGYRFVRQIVRQFDPMDLFSLKNKSNQR